MDQEPQHEAWHPESDGGKGRKCAKQDFSSTSMKINSNKWINEIDLVKLNCFWYSKEHYHWGEEAAQELVSKIYKELKILNIK